jgi:hypothetical protein
MGEYFIMTVNTQLTDKDMEAIILFIRRSIRKNGKSFDDCENFDIDKFLKNLITNYWFVDKKEAVERFVRAYFEEMKIYNSLINKEGDTSV